MKKIKTKIEKLLEKALKCRNEEDVFCTKVARILIDEYGYPGGISVLYQEGDGYVVSYEDNQRIDNMPVETCLCPYEKWL